MSLLAGDLYIRQVNLLDFSREDFVGEMDIWVKDGRIHKIYPPGRLPRRCQFLRTRLLMVAIGT